MAPAGNEGLVDPTTCPRRPTPRRPSRRHLGAGQPPPDVRRLVQARGPGPTADGQPIHLVNTDPPYNVKVEPRSNNAIAAGAVVVHGARSGRTHQRRPAVGGPAPLPGEVQADAQEAPGQGPAAGQRLRVRPGVRPPARGVVREHRPRAHPRRRVLHLGRLRQLRQLPAGAQGDGAVLQPGGDLDQGAPGPDAQGLHGQPRVVLLRLEGGAAHRFFGPNNVPDTWSSRR